MPSAKIKRLSKGMLMKKKSDGTASTMDTSVSSVMDERNEQPSLDTVASLSQREFEKRLYQEMKNLRKARVKSFQQKKALLGMPDIEEISEKARKAERLRQKRRSTACSTSGSSSSLMSQSGSSSGTHTEDDEPNGQPDHADAVVKQDLKEEEEEEPATPTTVCSTLRGSIPTELEFSIALPEFANEFDEDDHGDQQLEDGDEDAIGLHPQASIDNTASKDKEQVTGGDNSVTNRHSSKEEGEGEQLPPQPLSQDEAEATLVGEEVSPALTSIIEEKVPPATVHEGFSTAPTLAPTQGLIVDSQPESDLPPQHKQSEMNAAASPESFPGSSTPPMTNRGDETTTPPPSSLPPFLLDDDVSQLEHETLLLQEQVRKLELQLHQTQHSELEEIWIIKEQSSTAARNEAIAEQVRDEYHSEQQQRHTEYDTVEDDNDEDEYLLRLQQQRKEQENLVTALQTENKARRTESQALNWQMVSLLQSNQRLEKATQATQDFNRELQLTLIQETVNHHKALLVELQTCQRQEVSYRRQVPKVVAYAVNEKRVRQLYSKGSETIVRHVLEEAYDRRLIEAITEMPPSVITKSRRKQRGKSKSVAVQGSNKAGDKRKGGFCFLSS